MDLSDCVLFHKLYADCVFFYKFNAYCVSYPTVTGELMPARRYYRL
jgi:hypothetical protein